jgi:hypothetical protein
MADVSNSFNLEKIKKAAYGNNVNTSGKKNLLDKIIAKLPSKKALNEISSQLNNPFSSLKNFLEKIPLVHVSEKYVVLNVPWI